MLLDRDRVIEVWRKKLPDEDVLENREIEILTQLPISVESTLADLDAALARSAN